MATNRFLFKPRLDEGIKMLSSFTDDKHNVLAVSFRFWCTTFGGGYFEDLFVSVDCSTDPDKFTCADWLGEVEYVIDRKLSSPRYNGANLSLCEIGVFFDDADYPELNWRAKPDYRYHYTGYIGYRDKGTGELTLRWLTPDEFATIHLFDDVVSMLSEQS